MFDYDVVLLDIEGTTTPISFVKDILFPYVRDNVRDFLEKYWGTDQCRVDVEALRNQAKEDKDMEDVVLIPDEEENLSQENSGARVFDDVVTAFKRWTSNKIKIYIYSSGSTDSQKLLFGNSKCGNLLQYLSGHFDTSVGAKIELQSYKKIADAIDMKPSRILFVTDVVKESRAAFKAGYKTAISVRPGNAPLTEEDKRDFKVISSFDELFEDTEELSRAKRKSKVTD
ncbi:enolase-phosphatase E1-like isoform X1 [Stylophora pistillata]|uniref:enolase-phosphatase E1-like isoform X1 n=1 Tax=Stylophora pistillata TaxID=50429 RepID=UPI000C0490E2|nr:enolase-phosphatase E1-like isoform X1 [Stylophora pistillata]